MTIVCFLLALHCLYIGLAGAVYTERPKHVKNLSFLYFFSSLPAHIFAFQYWVLSAVLFTAAVTVLSPAPWTAGISGIAALTFMLNLWRSYKGHKALNAVLPDHGEQASMGDFIKGALRPLKMKRKGVRRIADVAYGNQGVKNTLDIYVPDISETERMAAPRPVIFHIHGGAWVYGYKKSQAQPLIQHLVSRGWMAVDINYRLAPGVKLPDIIEDVLRALAWTKQNIADYGGDPDFIASTGGSAGGHLTSLSALIPHDAKYKPGFEDADCTVDAAVPVYGVYDFLDRTGRLALGQFELEAFLTRYVMPGGLETHREVWDALSPLANVHADAPPMLIFHGRHDVLAAFEGAKIFAQAMAETSNNEVIFAALPSGQHAYDAAGSPPTPAHVYAAERFLNKIRAEKLARNTEAET